MWAGYIALIGIAGWAASVFVACAVFIYSYKGHGLRMEPAPEFLPPGCVKGIPVIPDNGDQTV